MGGTLVLLTCTSNLEDWWTLQYLTNVNKWGDHFYFYVLENIVNEFGDKLMVCRFSRIIQENSC